MTIGQSGASEPKVFAICSNEPCQCTHDIARALKDRGMTNNETPGPVLQDKQSDNRHPLQCNEVSCVIDTTRDTQGHRVQVLGPQKDYFEMTSRIQKALKTPKRFHFLIGQGFAMNNFWPLGCIFLKRPKKRRLLDAIEQWKVLDEKRLHPRLRAIWKASEREDRMRPHSQKAKVGSRHRRKKACKTCVL
ncbi:hypothetical protein NW761_003481 [Fusarium oxysporum]|nr:hypothetical protein NW758_001340 [Fusarium oxysporum]KAJ4100496.1 hypothetical protein NW761_003481 [Fusarium oxysporum]